VKGSIVTGKTAGKALQGLAGALRVSDILLRPVIQLYEIPENLPGKVDCLIGLAAGLCADGRPGPVTDAVARRCASLYLSGVSNLVIFTGGFTAGGKTEAEVMSAIAEGMGVPGQNILLEKESTRTHHHPPRVEPLLKSSGISSVLIVSNRLHSRRARAIFLKHFGGDLSMHFAKAKSEFGPTAQRRYISATTCLFWNIGTHLLARLKGWA